MVFHVATMMTAHDGLETEQLDAPSDGTTRSDRKYSSTTMKKKRHIGNDFVHIVFKASWGRLFSPLDLDPVR
jgi:hypothetical protein